MRIEKNVQLTTAAGVFLTLWAPLLLPSATALRGQVASPYDELVSREYGPSVSSRREVRATQGETSSSPSGRSDISLVSHTEESLVGIPWNGGSPSGVCRKCGPGWTCDDCMVPWPTRYWFQADYLVWLIESDLVPPLVTSAAPGDPAGLLGEPTTSILFGGTGMMDDATHGYRLTFGGWWNDAQTWAAEGDYFALGGQADTFAASSAGDPVLARPFFNVVTAAQASHLIALAGIVSGSVSAEARANYESAGARFRMNAVLTDWGGGEPGPCDSNCGRCSSCRGLESRMTNLYRLDVTAGYRWAQLDDRIVIRDSLVAGAAHPNFADGSTISITDSFRAVNEFQGAELGYSAEYYRKRWTFELIARLAMGRNRQFVAINGATVVVEPGPVQTVYPGGVLALPTNIGRYERNPFIVVPQFAAEVGYQCTPRLKVRLGYDVVMWSSVVRAGDQIDLNVNPTQIPPGALAGQASPAFLFDTSSFFTHGLNVGAELRY